MPVRCYGLLYMLINFQFTNFAFPFADVCEPPPGENRDFFSSPRWPSIGIQLKAMDVVVNGGVMHWGFLDNTLLPKQSFNMGNVKSPSTL